MSNRTIALIAAVCTPFVIGGVLYLIQHVTSFRIVLGIVSVIILQVCLYYAFKNLLDLFRNNDHDTRA